MVDITGAMARGYCTKRNSHKILDPDLIEDMASEVRKSILAELPKKIKNPVSVGDAVYNEAVDACRLAVAKFYVEKDRLLNKDNIKDIVLGKLNCLCEHCYGRQLAIADAIVSAQREKMEGK